MRLGGPEIGPAYEADVVGVTGLRVEIDLDAPLSLVDHVVMLRAEQDHVGDRGLAVVLPVDDVVRLAA